MLWCSENPGTDNACSVEPEISDSLSTQVSGVRLLAHAQPLIDRSGLISQAIHRRISRKNQARAGMSGQMALASKRVAFTKRSTFA
jgi:hypothetical protein